jgi:ribosomal protein L34E
MIVVHELNCTDCTTNCAFSKSIIIFSFKSIFHYFTTFYNGNPLFSLFQCRNPIEQTDAFSPATIDYDCSPNLTFSSLTVDDFSIMLFVPNKPKRHSPPPPLPSLSHSLLNNCDTVGQSSNQTLLDTIPNGRTKQFARFAVTQKRVQTTISGLYSCPVPARQTLSCAAILSSKRVRFRFFCFSSCSPSSVRLLANPSSSVGKQRKPSSQIPLSYRFQSSTLLPLFLF